MVTSVAVVGASGKLGSLVCQLVNDSADFELVAELNSSSDLTEMLAAEIVVDASLPGVSQQVVEFALSNDKSVLVATSGWSTERIAAMEPLLAAHPTTGAIFIANFSLGSALASHLATIAARHLSVVEIVETHGASKVDSPSGTAVATAERIAATRAATGEPVAGAPFADQEARGELVAGIPVHSIRLPGFLARQDVTFAGEGETVTISHLTLSNQSYAPGILASLRALVGLKGLVVGLDKVIGL